MPLNHSVILPSLRRCVAASLRRLLPSRRFVCRLLPSASARPRLPAFGSSLTRRLRRPPARFPPPPAGLVCLRGAALRSFIDGGEAHGRVARRGVGVVASRRAGGARIDVHPSVRTNQAGGPRAASGAGDGRPTGRQAPTSRWRARPGPTFAASSPIESRPKSTLHFLLAFQPDLSTHLNY